MIADFIGYIAGALIILSIVPQIVKSYKTKSVKDLSLLMLVLMISATLLWIVYGFMIDSKPVIVVNGVYLLVIVFQLFLKIKYGN